jgi:peptidoglycan/xylan/chitin deacetylase (PgdA/CDA1 family)
MSFRDPQVRRRDLARKRRQRKGRQRFAALGALASFVVVLLVVVLTTTSGSGSNSSSHRSPATTDRSSQQTSTAASGPTPGSASVPILAYHVINLQPAATSAPASLYVSPSEFASQMAALKTSGWHAVTLNQLEANWTRGASLGPGKPFVISFDTGYASQYTNALPVLKRLDWVGVLNLQVGGLTPADGGLTDTQIRGLLAAGWELDTKGGSATDLTTLATGQVQQEITTARQALRSSYGVPVNWFSYPSGNYDPNVIAAVKAAGFLGSTTVVPGWASSASDRFRLPRVEVVNSTSPSQLLSHIASAKSSPPPPDSYTSSGAP